MIESIFQIVIAMLMVRYLNKHDFGTFRQIMLIAVLIATTIAIGLPQSLSYFIPRADSAKEKKQLAFQIFIALTLLGVFSSITVYLFRFRISEAFNNPDLVQYSWIFSLFLLLLMPSKCTQPALVALGRTNFASLLNFGTAVLNFIFILVPLLMGKDMEIVLISMSAVYFLKLIVVIIILARLDGGIPKIMEFSSLKKQFLYSLPLGGSLMLGVTRKYIDQFIIAIFYNPVNFAVYSRGAFELPLVNLLPYQLSTLMIPQIATYYKDGNISGILYLWQESMRKVAMVLFPVFIYTFLFADLVITFLFTKEYLDSVPIFRIYLLILPFRIIAYRTILQATGHTKTVFKATLISVIVSVVFSIILERSFGIIGPAIGVLIGMLVAPVYLIVKTKSCLGVSYADLIPIGKLKYPMLCSIIMGVVVYPVSMLNLAAFPMLLISAVLYFLVYVVTMKLSGIFTDNEWDLICRWLTLKVIFNK